MTDPCLGCNPRRRCSKGGPIDFQNCKEEPVRTCTINQTKPCGCVYEHYKSGSVRYTPCNHHNNL